VVGKSSDTRWTETINYLNARFPADHLGDHINSLVPQHARKDISKELSLGWRSDGQDDPNYQAKSDARHALRGLLLCQRVYYSDQFWAQQSEAGEGKQMEPFTGLLRPGWKERSFAQWRGAAEANLLAGIGMFVPRPGATRADFRPLHTQALRTTRRCRAT
jgi:hypothetical protein